MDPYMDICTCPPGHSGPCLLHCFLLYEHIHENKGDLLVIILKIIRISSPCPPGHQPSCYHAIVCKSHPLDPVDLSCMGLRVSDWWTVSILVRHLKHLPIRAQRIPGNGVFVFPSNCPKQVYCSICTIRGDMDSY